MVCEPEWYLHIPSWISLITYSACSFVMHLSKGCSYPRLYKLSPTIMYCAAFDGHPLSIVAGRFPDFRYWIYEVIQLLAVPRFMNMFIVDGADSVCCRRDLYLLTWIRRLLAHCPLLVYAGFLPYRSRILLCCG